MDLMSLSQFCFAQTPAPAAPSTEQTIFQLIIFGFLGLLVLYFIIILPKRSQAKQEQNTKKMIDSLKKNDKVMTTSGMIGTVHSIDKEQNEIILKVDDSTNTKIKFSLGAIYFVYQDKKEEQNK